MTSKQPYRIKTITEFHRLRGLPAPEHPLISVVDYGAMNHTSEANLTSWVLDFYSISLKRAPQAKMRYGQQEYDFDEGVMFFMAPHQVFSVEVGATPPSQHSGWILLIHPDFLWNTPLAKSIQRYDYFDYSVHEALFLSEKEETTVTALIQNIQGEYLSNIDKFSQDIIIAQLELLFNYAERFYHRQFLTRKITNHHLLDRLENWLKVYFNGDVLAQKGIPTVQSVAEALNVSPNYLSSLLKVLTGQSTQQHIQHHLIEKAKERLSTTELSASEIAYELGFEHPQSFSKLFKNKVKLTPLQYRQSFR
jgi:AraC-like DNA-binding protein